MLRNIATIAVLFALGQQTFAQGEPPTLTVDVPVQISDLTRDVYGIQLDCDALSSDGNFVASGRTNFIDSSVWQQYQSELSQLFGSDAVDYFVLGEL